MLIAPDRIGRTIRTTAPKRSSPGEATWFEIAIVPTAQRFKPGQRLRLLLTSQDEGIAMQGLSHVTVGLQARNSIFSDSRLMVPVVGTGGK